jgi:hypothetical protein
VIEFASNITCYIFVGEGKPRDMALVHKIQKKTKSLLEAPGFYMHAWLSKMAMIDTVVASSVFPRLRIAELFPKTYP